MKIGILTQPLHNSPGGILQAFALQSVLKSLGHEPWIIRRDVDRFSWKWWLRRKVSCILHQLEGKEGTPYLNRKQWSKVNKNTYFFIDKYLNPKTKVLSTDRMLKCEVKHQNFDAYIVGSDQVWRPSYSPKITNYFLDFLNSTDKAKRIAYAASFGVDTWEFSKRETRKCGDLIRYFQFVSVREKTGVLLCKKYFHIKATQVLDPTLLLSQDDYKLLAGREHKEIVHRGLLCFILDKTSEKEAVIKACALNMDLSPFYVMPKLSLSCKNINQLDDCVYPSIAQWLNGFIEAEFVITDSFHGTVFSIIFNKPFLVIGNEMRGLTRIQSLLEIFNLQGRLMTKLNGIEDIYSSNIDWSHVNKIRKEMRDKSIQYLISALA